MPGWITVQSFEDVGCAGAPFNVTGNVLNVCSPLYGARGGGRGGGVPSTSRSYLFSSCVSGVSATYQEFSSTDCSGPAVVQRSIQGGCVPSKDPNSLDVWHVSSVNCYSGTALPPLPPNMVLQTMYADCSGAAPPVAFSAQSTLKCNMNDAGNAFTALYALSSSFACDAATGTPQTVGYLGTHCSKRSIVSTLSQSCAALPGWSGSRYATSAAYSCTAQAPQAPPTGWLTQTFFDSADCSGPVLSVMGQATGVCTTGYNNVSAIVQSTMTQCDGGTYLYNSPDCSGPATVVNALAQGSCQPNGGGFGLRFGGSGSSYSVGCSSDYGTIPMPFNGHSVVLYQYNNDLCSGYPTSFGKLPQDQPYVGGNGRYSQLVSCASGSPPTLAISISGLSTSTFTLTLDGACSYIDQAHSSSMSAQSRRNAANPLGLVYYSSQRYTQCEGTALPSPTDPLAPGPGPAAPGAAATMGGAATAGVIIGVLVAAGLGALATRRYIASRRESPSYLATPEAAATDALNLDTQNPLHRADVSEEAVETKKTCEK